MAGEQPVYDASTPDQIPNDVAQYMGNIREGLLKMNLNPQQMQQFNDLCNFLADGEFDADPSNPEADDFWETVMVYTEGLRDWQADYNTYVGG